MSETVQSAPTADIVEQVVAKGDLAKLTPEQRVSYYRAVCESLNLNPLTKPFEYISLNGKLTLYARKDATDQLRAKRHISITDIEREVVDDSVIATAHAETQDGRKDFDIGIVSLVGLNGELKANAIMKAVTKAKRRVTLSICGLGFLDETEIETIPDAQPVSDMSLPSTTELMTACMPGPEQHPTDWRAKYFAWLGEHGIEDNNFVQWLGREMFDVQSRSLLTPADWATLCRFNDEKGQHWYRYGCRLWYLAGDDNLAGIGPSLVRFLPHQFQCTHLTEMTTAAMQKCVDGVEKHIDRDPAAFLEKVLRWDAAQREPGSLLSELEDKLGQAADDSASPKAFLRGALGETKERWGAESFGALEEWQALWLLNRLHDDSFTERLLGVAENAADAEDVPETTSPAQEDADEQNELPF